MCFVKNTNSNFRYGLKALVSQVRILPSAPYMRGSSNWLGHRKFFQWGLIKSLTAMTLYREMHSKPEMQVRGLSPRSNLNKRH